MIFKTPYKKRLLNRINNRIRRKDVRLKLLHILGGPFCIICGFDNTKALHFGHIHDDGSIDLKRFKNKYEMYKYYVDNPEEARKTLQVVCATHNQLQEYERRKLN